LAVIDASVYVALISAHEKDHARSWAWFEQVRAGQEPIAAPVILLAEVASAVSRGVGDPELALRVVQQLAQSQVVDLVSVTRELAEQAAAIAAEHRVRGCDAVYIALAARRGDCLVTLDRQQLERGSAAADVQEPPL